MINDNLLKWSDRTFGMELEFKDVTADEYPQGYYIDELETILNSDGTIGRKGTKKGVEVCTQPITPTIKNLRVLRRYIKHMCKQGGTGLYFDAHLYIGDLTLAQIKDVATYIYMHGREIYVLFDVPDFLKTDMMSPLLSLDIYERIMEVEKIEDIENILKNSSAKGYLRTVISLSSYFKHKTLEFRCFNATDNFRETLETIKFMYSFLDFALRKKPFKAIVNKEKTPKKKAPMIITGADGFSTKPISVYPRKLESLMPTGELNAYDVRGGFGMLRVANTLFVNSYYALFLINIVDGYRPTLEEDIEYLQGLYTQDILNNVIVTLYLFEIGKVLSRRGRIGDILCDKEFISIENSREEFFLKNKSFALVLMQKILAKKILYGDLKDALLGELDVLMLSGVKNGSTVEENYIRLRCDLQPVKKQPINYMKIEEIYKSRLFIISSSPYLNFRKIGVNGRTYLYNNGIKDRRIVSQHSSRVYNIPLVEDGMLEVEDIIKVNLCNQLIFSYYRRLFIKKVVGSQKALIRVKSPFVVTINNKILGFFGVEFIEMDGEAKMLSDFVVNHNFYRGAKMVLMATKLKSVKTAIERLNKAQLKSIYTFVYTSNHVSMKYRGVYKKIEKVEKGLKYETKDIGVIENEEQLKKEFLKRYS